MESVVEVGGYVLVPGAAGTTIRSDGDAAGTTAEPLQHAFAEVAPPKEPESALATEVDEASQATAKIERAVSLCKGIGDGKILDPTQLALEVGVLLDCLERLDRKKEHKKAIQMARSLATLLMLLKRWADLLQTLRTALRAGEALGDQETIAWAKHELGTLRLAAGDLKGADRNLRQAQEIRERTGDRRGLAATERNLGALCDRLRQMLREGEPMEGSERRSAPTRLALFAVLLAIAFATAGFAAGSLTSGSADPGQPTSTENLTDPGEDEDPTTYGDDLPKVGTDEGDTSSAGAVSPSASP